MKKIVLLFGAAVVAILTTVAVQASEAPGCGVKDCGGGETKCCTQEGATYYLTRPA